MGNDTIINDPAQSEIEKDSDDPGMIKNESIIQIINSLGKMLRAKEKLFNILRKLLIIFITVLSTLFTIIIILYIVPVLKEVTSGQETKTTNNQELKKDVVYKKQINLMTRDIQRLSRKYNAFTSGQSYVVINTTENRFFLYRNKKLIREGFCSTGKLTMLIVEKGDKAWVFKTPKGKRWIQGKTTNPPWKRPDWSFIEEGLPVPPKDDPSRWESGVLGDYGLSMGDGYLIHGTIYKRFIGMPVTHGCVRLNDEDLEAVYNTLSIGSKVYIF
jgi:lipoprotein-anchoring transpeptidase ErfK/SrfK